MPRTALRICPLCEATCGLALTVDGSTVTAARGDRDDVFSRGFICPKGASFGAVDSDPDRLRAPLVRTNGELREATWEEAFDAVAAGVRPLVERYGPHSVGVVLGNPNVHTMAGALYPNVLLGALGSRSLFTASTLDQMPKHVSSGLLFGDANAIPVPDLDRTDHLLLIGANPLESNGSLCTAPDFPGRLRALKARGGTLTVVDPRRTRTAKLADRHVAIRPGSDALLLAAMAHVLYEEGLVDLGALAPHVGGVDDVAAAVRDFTPESVAAACDVDADVTRALARELAAAPTAAVYGRIGSCTVPHGTIASWLVDVLNILTGNLDRPGGALFPQAATDRTPRPAGPGRGFALGRWRSRVSGHPEAKGELPLSALAEEIDTATDAGEPVRALLTIAANPVLSAPDGDRLDKALESLDFMVSVDPYLNETSRHAHVVLPPPPPAQSPHHDFAFNTLAVRNQVRYTRPAVPLEPGRMAETEILARLTLAVTGAHGTDPAAVDALVIEQTLAKAVREPHSPAHGRDPAELDRPAHRRDRPRAAPRPDAAPRPLRRRLRRPARRADPGAAPRPPARHRPRPAAPPPAAAPEDPQRQGGTAPGTDRRRPAAPRTGPGRAPRRARPRRPPPPALQQQLDAQRSRPHRRLQPLHPARPSRGRRTAGSARGATGARDGPRRSGDRPRRGHRRRPARRRQPPARLGPRPARHPPDARRHRSRRQRQPAPRRQRARPALGQRRTQRRTRHAHTADRGRAVTWSSALIARMSTSC